ncbi:MAG: hypothetical protein V4819_09110 [Verrucomicrobiota bacterium]
MNTNIALVLALALATLAANAQGPLTPPPGAPAPVMKSLDQVEARTPLVAGQPGVGTDSGSLLTITASGSYYLTGNLNVVNSGQHGIRIVGAVDVTIDLNGFTLTGASGTGSGYGIYPDGHASGQNVRICNGNIRGTTTTGFLFAIADDGITPYPQVCIENVHCMNVRNGIDMSHNVTGVGSIVRDCTVVNSGGRGIKAATVEDCSVVVSGGVAIEASSLVSRCVVRDSIGDGIVGQAGAVGQTSVTECYASSSANGIVAGLVSESYGNGGGSGNRGIWTSTATQCRARHSSLGSNTALEATIAIGCSLNGGVAVVTNKYNMP